MSEWADWIGRAARAVDRLDPALAQRWCATFDRGVPADGVMPQGIHLCLCTPDARSDALGEDGHPARDDSADSFLPPIPLPRRMWASSAMEFHHPISVGAAIERVSRIASIEAKSGSRGDMVFVEVDHETKADGQLAVSERQTLVYLPAVPTDAPLSPPPPGDGQFDLNGWDARRMVMPDPRLLFRYSALTFNTHRIHYDAPYARDVERYRGIVVHGPLSISLLLQLADTHFGANRLRQFTFRGVSPAIVGEALHYVLKGDGDNVELGAFAGDGRQVAKAGAVVGM